MGELKVGELEEGTKGLRLKEAPALSPDVCFPASFGKIAASLINSGRASSIRTVQEICSCFAPSASLRACFFLFAVAFFSPAARSAVISLSCLILSTSAKGAVSLEFSQKHIQNGGKMTTIPLTSAAPPVTYDIMMSGKGLYDAHLFQAFPTYRAVWEEPMCT